MQIDKHTFVTIDYVLSDEKDIIIDSSKESGPLIYMHGSGNLIPGLESSLKGKTTGEKFTVTIPPEKGYGTRDDSFVHVFPKEHFNEIENIQVGMDIQIQEGNSSQVMSIIKIENDEVTLDGNHPLAGKTLTVEIDVKEVREATTEELEQFYSSKMGCQSDCGSGCDSC